MLGLFYPYGIVLQAHRDSALRAPPAGHLLALDHPDGRRRSARWSTSSSRSFPMPGCCAAPSRCSRAASASRSSKRLILDNPSIGNYEELGDLYLDDGQFARARECFDRVIARCGRRSIRSIAARCASWRWTISPPPPPISSRSSRRPEVRLPARRRACSRTPRRGLGEREKADALFAEVAGDVDALGNAVQLRVLPRRQGPAPPRRANGPSASCARRRRCPTTSAAGSGRGFARPARCSSGCRGHERRPVTVPFCTARRKL